MSRNRKSHPPTMPRREFLKLSAVGVGALGATGATESTAAQVELQSTGHPAQTRSWTWGGKSRYNGLYAGDRLNRVAFPLGGLGAGMICFEGKGARILGPTRIGAHGTPIFFLHPKDMGGVLTEIMESPKQAH